MKNTMIVLGLLLVAGGAGGIEQMSDTAGIIDYVISLGIAGFGMFLMFVGIQYQQEA